MYNAHKEFCSRIWGFFGAVRNKMFNKHDALQDPFITLSFMIRLVRSRRDQTNTDHDKLWAQWWHIFRGMITAFHRLELNYYIYSCFCLFSHSFVCPRPPISPKYGSFLKRLIPEVLTWVNLGFRYTQCCAPLSERDSFRLIISMNTYYLFSYIPVNCLWDIELHFVLYHTLPFSN